MLAETIPPNEAIDTQIGQCRRLAKVLMISKEMLNSARDDDWDEVSRLDAARKTDLQLCFSQETPSNDSPVVAEAIAALLHINEEIMALIKQARDRVSMESRELNRNKSAINSYLNSTR